MFLIFFVINIAAFIKFLLNKNKQTTFSSSDKHDLSKSKHSEKNASLLFEQTSVVTKKHDIITPFNSMQDFIQTFQLSWVLLMTLLLRTHNSILVAMVICQEKLLWRYSLKDSKFPSSSLALLIWWIGQAGYFQQVRLVFHLRVIHRMLAR